MADIAGIPYFELEFDKDAKAVHPEQQQALIDAAKAAGASDLLVMSHGWNNDIAEARALYKDFFTNLATDLQKDNTIPTRRFVIAGIFWPSKKFADKDLIPGGAAGTGDDVAADKMLLQQIATLAEITGKDLSHLKELVPQLNDKKSAREKFSKAVLELMPDEETAEGDRHFTPQSVTTEIAEDKFLQGLGMQTLAGAPQPGAMGGAAGGVAPQAQLPNGGAAGIGDFFRGIKAGAMNLLNVTTYYKMKERAGIIGERALNPALRAIRQTLPNVRIHLMGHSFGGRVVTAAAAGKQNDAPVRVNSISLLQAAFSHYAFAKDFQKGKSGFFRRVVDPAGAHLTGPMIVTHSRADKAVGIAYAIASRIKGQIASAIGGPNDPYGGLGGNGAQSTPEHVDVKIITDGTAYAYAAGKVYNIDGNGTIDGHGDVRRTEVTHAVADAIRVAP